MTPNVEIMKNLDPATVTDGPSLQRFVGATIGAFKEVGDDLAAQRTAADDLSKKLQAAAENAAAKPPPRAIEGSEADLGRRYVGEDGKLRLMAERRTFKFAGKQFEAEMPGLLDDTVDTCAWQKDLRRALTIRNLARLAMKRPSTPDMDAKVAFIANRAPAAIREKVEKAFYDYTNVGGEWIPDQFVPDLYEEFQVPRGLASLFETIPMERETMIRPKLTTGVRPYIKSEITSDDPAAYTASTPVTDSGTITVGGLAARVVVDDAAAEDSAVAVIPTLSRLVTGALVDGYEDAIVNGDTAGTHEDAVSSWNVRSRWGTTGLGGAADHRRAFLGLRALAYDRSLTADGSAAQTSAGLAAVIGAMGERAASDLILVVSPEVMFTKLMADSYVVTVDKFGPAATILTGQLAALFGHPIIMSRFVSADLATTGLYTGTGSYSGVLVCDRSAFANYQRRAAIVEIDKEIKSGHIEIVATMRRIFYTLSGATEKVVAWNFKWL